MLKINNKVSEMDFGDQMILDIEGKAVGLNRTGREIYLQLKKNKSIEEIIDYMEKEYGKQFDYSSDIIKHIQGLKKIGIVLEGENEQEDDC